MHNINKESLTPEFIKLKLASEKTDSRRISASMFYASDNKLKDDLKKIYKENMSQAAVLLPILNDKKGLKILLTRRNKELRTHPGQISFPGGKMEKNDIDYVFCALREAREEVGIRPSSVRVLGCLDECITGSGFLVKPVVGFIKDKYHLVLNYSEVTEIYKIPLVYFLDPARFKIGKWEGPNGTRTFYDISWRDIRIWGATARILVNFYEHLNQTRFS